MRTLDLNGTWRAVVADEERRRDFADVGTSDAAEAGWTDLVVPSHWRTTANFAATDGPLLTRRHFHLDTAGSRWWLVLDGVFYQGDVWIDGRYVGDTEGYFFPHSFDVTDLLHDDPDHVLAVEVACSPQTDPTAKRNLTGSLQHSTWLEPDWNPGGIWQGVRLEESGPLRIRHLRVRCTEATRDRAVLACRAVIDAIEPGTARLLTEVTHSSSAAATSTSPSGDSTGRTAAEDAQTLTLAAGENRVEWQVEISNPDLWWPHALGAQPLYDVAISAHLDDEGTAAVASHRRQVRTGLRRVEMRRWILHVNGERMFLKGTNLGPTRQDLAGASPESIAADVRAARDVGLDMVRVHTHIARPELYEAADELGMIVWQDLPLQWGYARSVRKQAVRQAREAVDLLAHHPSLAVWCGHNEPLTIGAAHHEDATADRPGGSRELRRMVLGQVLPSWNRSILDRSIRRTLRSVDGTRPVIAHSGVLPHLPQLDGTDSHLWFGWEYGEIDDLADLASRWPRLVRFVSELGAQAVPTTADFCEPHRWPDLDWERLSSVHGLQRELLDLIADPDDAESFAAWRDDTQRYQAELLRRQIETLRRLKYRPTGGFAQFLFADAHPSISPSVLDHRRRAKQGLDALAAACRPVIVVADPLPPAGRSLPATLDVHVVSDRRHPLGVLTATASLTVDGTTVEHRWTGDVPADDCVLVGTVAIPRSARHGDSAQLVLTLHDAEGELVAANEYRR
jgi:beta-mannosidase